MKLLRKLFGVREPARPAEPVYTHYALLVPFKNEAGEWHFHAVNPGNHKIIFTSGEPFDSKSNAERACNNVAHTKFTVMDA